MDQEANVGNAGQGAAGGSDIESQRAQIEETRAQMSGTVDAIEARLSPENLTQRATQSVHDATIGKVEQALNNATDTVQQAAGSTGNTVTNTGSNIIDTIKNNPVPAALAGLGIGWLIASGSSNGSSNGSTGRGANYGYGGTYPYATGGYYGGQNPSQQGQGVTGQVQDVANQAQDTAGRVANQAQNAAGQVVNQTQQTTQQAVGSVERMTSSNPLAMGAVALALGAAVGLVVPETRKENELMGQASQSVTQKAGDVVQQEVQKEVRKVKTVAEDVAGAAQQAAKNTTK